MRAKKFKEIISQIPDDDELIFTYSMFEFENVGNKLFSGQEIVRYFNNDFSNVPHSKKTWMLEFKN